MFNKCILQRYVTRSVLKIVNIRVHFICINILYIYICGVYSGKQNR